MITSKPWPRRQFIKSATIATGGLVACGCSSRRLRESSDLATQNKPVSLPEGSAPSPLPCPHFPNRLCAFVWRNWQLVPLDRMAAVVGASTADIRSLGDAMGLGRPPRITVEQQRRSYITVIKRNWFRIEIPARRQDDPVRPLYGPRSIPGSRDSRKRLQRSTLV